MNKNKKPADTVLPGAPITFDEKVYAAVRDIPRGCVMTYGHVALLCGVPRAARAVGRALHRNPYFGQGHGDLSVPCHRVVNRMGRLAPAFGFGGPDVQRRLLEAEGVTVTDGHVDLRVYGWRI